MRAALAQATGALNRFRSAVSSASSAGGRLRTSATQSSAQLKQMSASADKAARDVRKAGQNASSGGGMFQKLSGGLKGATTAQRGLNTAMKGNAMGLLLSLLAPIISKLVDMAMKSKPVQDALKKLGDMGRKALGWIIDAA